jgi:hypothetical protein
MLAVGNLLTAPYEVQHRGSKRRVEASEAATNCRVRAWEAAKAAVADSDPSHTALPDKIRTRSLAEEKASTVVAQLRGIQTHRKLRKDLDCAAHLICPGKTAFDPFQREARSKRRCRRETRTPLRGHTAK